MPVLGGLASASAAGSASLFRDGDVARPAARWPARSPGVPILPCVSQGAAPVGPEMTITAAERQRDRGAGLEAGDRAAARGARRRSSRASRQLAASGLMLGIVIDENQPEYRARRLPGAADHRRRRGGRDDRARRAGTGRPDRPHAHPRRRLRRRGPARGAARPGRRRSARRGRPASCSSPATAAARTCSRCPTTTRRRSRTRSASRPAGFFCAGEIGPVGGRNFLHGFTATMAVFADEWRGAASWRYGCADADREQLRIAPGAGRGPRRGRHHLRGDRSGRRPGQRDGSCRSSPASSSGSRSPPRLFAQAGAPELRAARDRRASGATRSPPTSRSSRARRGRCSAAERTALNLLCHLSGVATLTARFVRRGRGNRRGDPRHAQDDPGPAGAGEGRGRGGRRAQPPHGPARRGADQGEPHRPRRRPCRGGAARPRGRAGARDRGRVPKRRRGRTRRWAPAPTACCWTTWSLRSCGPRSPRATRPRRRTAPGDPRGLGRDHPGQRRARSPPPGSTSSRSAPSPTRPPRST